MPRSLARALALLATLVHASTAAILHARVAPRAPPPVAELTWRAQLAAKREANTRQELALAAVRQEGGGKLAVLPAAAGSIVTVPKAVTWRQELAQKRAAQLAAPTKLEALPPAPRAEERALVKAVAPVDGSWRRRFDGSRAPPQPVGVIVPTATPKLLPYASVAWGAHSLPLRRWQPRNFYDDALCGEDGVEDPWADRRLGGQGDAESQGRSPRAARGAVGRSLHVTGRDVGLC